MDHFRTLLKVLERLEWTDGRCPYCGAVQESDQHDDSCDLAQSIDTVTQQTLTAESVTVVGVKNDPAVSMWLRVSLGTALSRDPVDAANDAEVLYYLLVRQLDERFQSQPGG